MGIVNVTPDSFSDGGSYFDATRAVEHALALVADGADIVDVGGESTRPPGTDYGAGSTLVDADEEVRRVRSVIEGIRRAAPSIDISIDTMKPSVAEQALDAGATIINDVSAGRYDRRIWEVAAASNVPYVLMHGHDPHNRVRADQVRYSDVVQEVYEFLETRIAEARRAGVRTIVGDVGIGFAKGGAYNLELIRRHRRFTSLGVPLLIGASRKAFLGELLGGVEPLRRDIGSLAAHAAAVLGGASIIRTHNVRATREFIDPFVRMLPRS